MKINVRIQPRAAKAGVVGWENGALKVKVNAPPVDGAANEALIEILSETFKLPKSRLRISSGEASRNKVVEFINSDPALQERVENYVRT